MMSQRNIPRELCGKKGWKSISLTRLSRSNHFLRLAVKEEIIMVIRILRVNTIVKSSSHLLEGFVADSAEIKTQSSWKWRTQVPFQWNEDENSSLWLRVDFPFALLLLESALRWNDFDRRPSKLNRFTWELHKNMYMYRKKGKIKEKERWHVSFEELPRKITERKKWEKNDKLPPR